MAASQLLTLVTGATQGIGRAVAQALAQKHGHHVLVGARNLQDGEKVAAEIRDAGFSATAIQLDLTSRESVKRAVANIERDYGYLDVLINNAGVQLDTDKSLDTWDQYNQTFAVNVIGTATLTEGLLPFLRQAKAGPPRLVFVSSRMGSLELATDKTTIYYKLECSSYDASKAAVNMIMLNYNRKLDGTGAKVNSVCPGLVKTRMTGFSKGHSPEVGAENIVKMATLGPDGPTGTFGDSNGPMPW